MMLEMSVLSVPSRLIADRSEEGAVPQKAPANWKFWSRRPAAPAGGGSDPAGEDASDLVWSLAWWAWR